MSSFILDDLQIALDEEQICLYIKDKQLFSIIQKQLYHLIYNQILSICQDNYPNLDIITINNYYCEFIKQNNNYILWVIGILLESYKNDEYYNNEEIMERYFLEEIEQKINEFNN